MLSQTYVDQLVIGVVELCQRLVGHPVHAVEPELVYAYRPVAVDVDGAERAVDEELEGLGVGVGIICE